MTFILIVNILDTLTPSRLKSSCEVDCMPLKQFVCRYSEGLTGWFKAQIIKLSSNLTLWNGCGTRLDFALFLKFLINL